MGLVETGRRVLEVRDPVLVLARDPGLDHRRAELDTLALQF